MYQRKDSYYRKAKQSGYRARSAYKLFDLDKKYDLIKESDNILDLGCAPGSWLQACSQIASSGFVLGVDLVPIAKIDKKKVQFIKGDIFDNEIIKKIKEHKFDVVLSDMAPKTTGIKDLDVSRSMDLCNKALEIVKACLKQNGNFLCKAFQGQEFNEFLKTLKRYFSLVKCTKPSSSRKSSIEMYVVCKGFKPENQRKP